MGVLVALTTTLCWSLGIFPFTEAARRLGSSALNQYRLFLAWIIITLISCFYFRFSPLQMFQSPSAHNYIFLGLSGIVGFTIGDFCAFNSFKMLGPKLASLYTSIAPCAALVMGVLVLGEDFNWVGVTGILITIAGVVWLTLSKKDAEAASVSGFKRNRAGIIYGTVGALCQGCGLVLSKHGFKTEGNAAEIPTLQAVWIRLMFAFSAAMFVSFISGNFIKNSKTILTNQNQGLKFMITGTLLGPVCGVSCSLLAISYLKVAEAQTIFALLPIFVLPLNYLVYKEKITVTSFFACFTAICGVFVLIWRETIASWI